MDDPDKDWAKEDPDPEAVVEQIEDCLERMDEASAAIWERAYEFFESVKEKLQGIQQTIQSSGRCTHRQQEAVENMVAGVERWLEQDENQA